MASGSTPIYDIPYPVVTDPVDVHGDIQDLAERIEAILPSIGLPFHEIEVTNLSGFNITKASPVYISGFDGTTAKPTVASADASDLNTFPVVGLAEANIADNTSGVIILSGIFTGVNTSSFSAGDVLYVATGGGLTATQPTSGSGAVGVVAKSDSTTGIIIVGTPKGNGTWGSMKAGLA